MHRYAMHEWISRILLALQIVSVFLLGALTFCLRYDSSRFSVAKTFIDWNKANADVVGPSLAALIVVVEGFRRIIGSPWAWRAIQATLDAFRDELFRGSRPPHHDRVTLFRRRPLYFWPWPWRHRFWPWGFSVSGKRCWPGSGWLFPVARSSHVSQLSRTVFLCPDNPDDAEGLAGQAFGQDKAIPVDHLPDMQSNPTDHEIQEYAERGYLSVEMVRARIGAGRICARSFYAFPIEGKDKLWGAVVLDSREPNGIKANQVNGPHYRELSAILKKLLERA